MDVDEDLKVVITSELEADERASAQRISAQLPNIEKLINASGRVRVHVTLDESGAAPQTQQIMRQVDRVAAGHRVGVNLSMDQTSINRVRDALSDLHVNSNITQSVVNELDNMGVRIDQVRAHWDEANNESERMLNLTIQGTDQLGRNISMMQVYNGENGEVLHTTRDILVNLERQRQIEDRLAATARTDSDSRIAFLTKQRSLLAEIQASYTGATSAKPVQDEARLAQLNAEYERIQNTINALSGQSGKLYSENRANISSEIAQLKRLAKEYQNTEYVATSLRTRTAGEVNSGQAKELALYEEKLRSAGMLTQKFQGRIATLRAELKTAFDQNSLTAYLNHFSRLQNSVATFTERIRSVGALYSELSRVDDAITKIRVSMTGVDQVGQKEQYAALQNELHIQEEIRRELLGKAKTYRDVITYSKEYADYQTRQIVNEGKLSTATAKVQDSVRVLNERMGAMPDIVGNVEARFRTLNNPTDELRAKVSQLRTLMDAVGDAQGDQDKVAAYNRLQEAITGCNREITAMRTGQRFELMDDKAVINLEKARADLETVGRQWSQLRNVPGLNAQFQQLQNSLRTIDPRNHNEMSLWTAQFNAFKSEVKAAGANVQSLGDILRSNLGKVLQWVSATTLLFRAFSLLRNAASTVIALDTAMVDLRKTTDATEAEYRDFYYTANETAKALGATTEEIIAQTAEWSRLGYTMSQAALLAENSAIFAAVSPDLDLQTSTDGLVSIIKAFDEIEVEDTLDGVISKVNEVGNSFAVSNGDIVEALTRSSSAMAAANNTFDETVALATAAIEITRDASTVGKEIAQCCSNAA